MEYQHQNKTLALALEYDAGCVSASWGIDGESLGIANRREKNQATADNRCPSWSSASSEGTTRGDQAPQCSWKSGKGLFVHAKAW